jgi:hypothetical protein
MDGNCFGGWQRSRWRGRTSGWLADKAEVVLLIMQEMEEE